MKRRHFLLSFAAALIAPLVARKLGACLPEIPEPQGEEIVFMADEHPMRFVYERGKYIQVPKFESSVKAVDGLILVEDRGYIDDPNNPEESTQWGISPKWKNALFELRPTPSGIAIVYRYVPSQPS